MTDTVQQLAVQCVAAGDDEGRFQRFCEAARPFLEAAAARVGISRTGLAEGSVEVALTYCRDQMLGGRGDLNYEALILAVFYADLASRLHPSRLRLLLDAVFRERLDSGFSERSGGIVAFFGLLALNGRCIAEMLKVCFPRHRLAHFGLRARPTFPAECVLTLRGIVAGAVN